MLAAASKAGQTCPHPASNGSRARRVEEMEENNHRTGAEAECEIAIYIVFNPDHGNQSVCCFSKRRAAPDALARLALA